MNSYEPVRKQADNMMEADRSRGAAVMNSQRQYGRNGARTGAQAERRPRLAGHLLLVCLICAVALGMSLPLQMEAAAAAETPQAVYLTSVAHKGGSLIVKWEAVPGCTGYQIQYADNRLFHGKVTVNVKGSEVTSKKITRLSKEDTYYVRIRAVNKDGSGTARSAWVLSANALADKNVKVTPVKKLLKKLELRRAAKQSIPGYDTLQGACYGKGYMYYLLEDRRLGYRTGRCKIVKMDLKKKKVVKVSGGLVLSHGNDMTFDTKRNRIVVAHSTPVPKYISVVNPNSLKVMSTQSVELPKKLKGMKPYHYRHYNGFGAISYNAKHDRYVVLLRGETFHHLLILNGKFKPVRFVGIEDGRRADQTVQGIDSYDDYVVVCQSYSPGKPYNSMLVYDWNGNRLSKLTISRTYELEAIFHTSKGFYLGYYTSFWKYSVLKRKNMLQRDNYIYKLSGF